MSEKEREANASSSAQLYPNVVSSRPPPPPASTSPQSDVMSSPPIQPPPYSMSPLADTQYWQVAPSAGNFTCGYATLQSPVEACAPKPKSLLEAYLLGLPLGVLGAHHFYLGRPAFGLLYLFTLGLLGCGWLFDLLRMPCLVSSVNRANKERYVQLLQLREQLQQQRQQQQQVYGGATQQQPPALDVVFVPFEPRSLADAYILWFPFGLLGFHHFYLRNYGFGALYFFTLGLLGLGWLIDLFRMPGLVREANSPRLRGMETSYQQGTAHALALTPAGIVGAHHFYLDRPVWGCLYVFTFGLVGVGWVFDWFRTSCLVKRANAIRRGERSRHRKYVDDAYILCIPWGFTGLHHFYLNRYGWGCLYFFTFGILGIGWIVDWFRLPWLVKEHNANLEMRQRLISASAGSGNESSGVKGVVNPEVTIQTQATVAGSAPYPPGTGYVNYQTTYPNPAAGYQGGGYNPGFVGQGVASPPSYEASVDSSGKGDHP